MRRSYTYLFLLVAAVIAIAFFYKQTPGPTSSIASVSEGQATGEASIGGPFTLVDQNGKTVTDQDYRDKLMLVYFGFASCPDICPTDLTIMSEAAKQLGDQASKVAWLFITIDPERDTAEMLKTYMGNFHPALQGLTGTSEQIKDAIKAYRVYAQKVPQKDGYTMDHSSFMYLMDRQGKFITHFTHNTRAEDIAKTIREQL